MPVINVSLIAGRTLEQKREFAKELTELTARVLKCPKDDVTIIFQPMQTDELAKGGVLRCDENK